MKMLSDNVRYIDDNWAIGRGRYVGVGLMNQRFLSTTGDGKCSMTTLHTLGRQLGEGNA